MKPYQLSSSELPSLNEAMTHYGKEVSNHTAFQLSRERLTPADFFDDKLMLIHAISYGITFRFFATIQEIAPFSEEEWANYLNISLKTLQRNKKEKDFIFKPIHSEKIIELFEVVLFGLEVFDSKEQFHKWLLRPSLALGSMTPAKLLENSYGKELVMNALNAIDQGIFA